MSLVNPVELEPRDVTTNQHLARGYTFPPPLHPTIPPPPPVSLICRQRQKDAAGQGTEADIREGERNTHSNGNCVSCIRERNVKNLGYIVTGIMFLEQGTEADIREGERNTHSNGNCVSSTRERNVKNLGNIVTGIMLLAQRTEADIGEGARNTHSTGNCVSCTRERNVKYLGT
jgi:hypothetical protein